MWMWWNRRRRQDQRLEEIRQERGKLALAVNTLDRKRHNVEQLMQDMLKEVEETRRA